jgi:PAS domain S-box-containing protein
MKPRHIVPNDSERILPTDRYILSTTDLAGRITSVNDLFVEYSGYTEPELVGQQHNIVRHPDMPRAVFQLLWDAVAEGEQFMGYVKNLCKDGSFYWVFAHVSPITDAWGRSPAIAR